MVGFLARPWRTQPQQSYPLDRRNPLTRGLVFAFNAATRALVPGGQTLVPVGSPTYGAVGDTGLYTEGASSYLKAVLPLRTYSSLCLVAVTTPTALVGGAAVFGLGRSTTITPFVRLAQGVSDISKVLFDPRGDNNGTTNASVESSGSAFVAGRRVTIGYQATGVSSPVNVFINGVRDATTTTTIADQWTIDQISIGGLYLGTDPIYTPYNGTTSLALVYDRVLSDAEHASLAANPWQIYVPLRRRSQPASGAVVTWIGPDVSGTGWLSTAATRWEAIDEAGAADDADYITSPYLTSSAVPAVETLTTPLTAGNYAFSVRARLTDALGSATLRVRFLSALNADVGVTAGQALTSTFATYSMSVTLSGTATQLQIEVVSP